MSYALCPECGGDGTVAPDRGATGRPWCRPCLGTGLLTPTQAFERGVRQMEPKVREALERAVEELPTAPIRSCACGGDAWSCEHAVEEADDAGDGETGTETEGS